MEDMVSVATAVALVSASSVSRYVDGNAVKEDRISPIWHVTAVHGRTPMKAPMAHCRREMRGRARPEKKFMLDQGTIPRRRKIARRAQGEDFEWVEEGVDPSNAMRVSVLTDGKKRVMMGVSGAAINVAIRDPIVVKRVWRSVAKTGGNSAPVRMFYK
jgi:hypothetical protein